MLKSRAALSVPLAAVLAAGLACGAGEIKAAAAGSPVATVSPVTANLPGGGTETTYALPDGETITSVSPPAGFKPLTASDAELTEYGFPLPPTGDPTALAEWRTAMADYRSDAPPAGSIQVVTGNGMLAGTALSTKYANWAGYIAGKQNSQSHKYVGVKADFSVPTNSNTCTSANKAGMWIGLGGTTRSNPDNLVQQGIVCGDPAVGPGSAYRPFTEFANTDNPVAFCGYKKWTLPAGHLIYQNMSYQSSPKKAHFFLEDEKTGVGHGCKASPPRGWSYDGNTAEWAAEAPTGTAVHFSAVHFTFGKAELDSTGAWGRIGAQSPLAKLAAGASSRVYCIAPGKIGSDKQSFTDSWHQATCY